tara:strand:- start:212 stop:598 length:387 start_codon:yes stop_codon:yes gene_type:complete
MGNFNLFHLNLFCIQYKLGDFGLSRGTNNELESEPETEEGDSRYLSLEALQQSARNDKVDIFALGMTMYEVATQTELPPNGKDWYEGGLIFMASSSIIFSVYLFISLLFIFYFILFVLLPGLFLRHLL